MSDIVLDYSWERPDPTLMSHYAVGVMRYVSRDNTGKNITAAERDALHAAGLPIGLVWETTADMMQSGPLGGARDAAEMDHWCDALGYPRDCPAWYANDRNSATGEAVGYMAGVKAVSKRPIGAYGSTAFLDASGAPYRWHVSTWGKPTAAQLVQEANMLSPIPRTDINTVHGDWGGWLPGAPPVPVPSGPTGLDLLHAAYMFEGLPYSTAPGRTQPEVPWADCSGLIVKAFLSLVPPITPGGTVSTTLETWAIATGGRYLTRDEAMRTPGAGCSIWGVGSNGHIGLSRGDGTTWETPSAGCHCVGASPWDHDRWERYFTFGVLDHVAYREDDDDMGFLATLHYHTDIWYCRAGVRSKIPLTSEGKPSLEVIAQLANKGAIPNPVKQSDLDPVGPATLELYTEQPWDPVP